MTYMLRVINYHSLPNFRLLHVIPHLRSKTKFSFRTIWRLGTQAQQIIGMGSVVIRRIMRSVRIVSPPWTKILVMILLTFQFNLC